MRNFAVLQPIFACNTRIETLNLADCKIDGAETAKLGANLQKNVCLRELYLRNCQIGDEGAAAIARLVGEHPAMTDLELFNCGISVKGGNTLGNSLKTNFRIQKLSIGENVLDVKDVEQILQSVTFNTQYNQMKDANSKFEGFAHTLIAESLKKWSANAQFVKDKLKQRLTGSN